MELEVTKKESNYLEFTIKGERHTFPNLLKAALLNQDGIEFISYVLDHPLGNNAKFVLRTKGKSPEKALSSACTEIEKNIADFQKAVKKALK
ncbi:MAG: DNA-directed RNA polymerase subunit L [Candidatus Diapherotrites archaeon]